MRLLLMLLSFLCIFCLPQLPPRARARAQSHPPGSSTFAAARSLDSLLQDYAYRAFLRPHPRTGTPYDVLLPSNFTGIQVSALRLRSGSLRTRGFNGYKEFDVPTGVIERPYVKRLIFVYQNLANWSSFYYPLPGYTYLAPVLGLLAYNATDLSTPNLPMNLPELDVRASNQSISIKFTQVQSAPDGSNATAKCIWFDLEGLPQFSNLSSGNVCSTVQQGHFSIVVESTSLPPSPVSPPSMAPEGGGGRGRKKGKSNVWKIVVSAIGGFLLLVLLASLIFWLRSYKRKKKMQRMEKAAEVGEALQMTSIGNTRAPVAMGTRTQPVLETEPCIIQWEGGSYLGGMFPSNVILTEFEVSIID